MADLSAQLQLNQQINKAITDRSALITQQTTLLTQQLNIAKQLRDALGGEAARESAGATRDMTAAIQDANDAAQEGADRQSELSAALGATSKQSGIASKAFKTFAKAAGAGFAAVGSLAGGLFDVIGTIGKLSLSIVSIPFKMFGKLFETARDFGDAMQSTALRQAMEDVRKEFGDLASGPGKAVIQSFSELRKQSSNLAGTGLRVSQVFGFGAEGLAAMLKEVQGLASATGEKFHLMQDVFRKSGGSLAMMSKGLGLSHENMSALMTLAEARGENVEKTMSEFSKTAVQTAKHFGLGIKDLANGMAELIKDVSTFGHLGPKAFAPMVVYARKLGLEVKSLAGVMKKFSGFSETAQAASEMSAAFGLNVDAMKLMAEQDPTKKVDMLRKAFFATGKTIKDMSYQERQYLQQLSGFEGEDFERVFGDAKRGVQQKKIQSETEKATAATMKQAKVMKELGKQIERMVHLMQRPKVTGFFDSLGKGFEKGVMKSEEVRGLLRNIDRSAQIFYRTGIQIGKMFVKMFPGVKDTLGAMKEFFEPKRFQAFADRLKSAFEQLMNGDISFKKFFETIFTEVDELGKPSGKLFKKIEAGFEKFVGFLLKGVGELLATATEKLVVPFVKSLTEFFQRVGEKMKGGKGPYEAIFGTLTEGFDSKKTGGMFQPLFDSFSEIGKMIGPLLKPLYEAAKPVLEPIFKDLGDIATKAFLSGAAASLLGSVGTWFSGISMAFNIARFFKGPAAAAGEARAATGILSRLSSVFGRVLGSLGPKLASFAPKLLGLLKAIPFLGTIIAAAFGIWDAVNFGSTPEDKEMAKKYGVNKFTVFADSMLSGMTFGLLGGNVDKLREIHRATKELVKKAAEAQQMGFQEESKTQAELFRENAKKLAAGGKGSQADVVQALKDAAFNDLVAQGLDSQSPAFKAKLKEIMPTIEAQAIDLIKEAAAANEKRKLETEEKEFFDKITKAKTVASQVQDLGKLETDLKEAKAKIAKLQPESLGTDLKEIMPKYIQSLTVIANALNSPEVQAAIANSKPAIESAEKMLDTAMDPINELSKTFNLFSESIKGIRTHTEQMNADLIKAPFKSLFTVLGQDKGLVDVVYRIDEMTKAIVTANGTLTPENLANVKPILDAVKDFKGGTLQVQHNLPNTKIELTVNIDSKKIGTELLQVDLGDSNASPTVRTSTYFGTGQQPTKIVGD